MDLDDVALPVLPLVVDRDRRLVATGLHVAPDRELVNAGDRLHPVFGPIHDRAGMSRASSRLWELIRADVAEAELIELTISQFMQFIHHVVVATLKRRINPIRLQYLQFKGSF